MKKRYISGFMVLALLLFGCCGQQQSYIGAGQAKQLALDTCGKTAEEAESVTADMFNYNGEDYYRIDIIAGGQHYQVEIDALVGAVTEVRVTTEVRISDGLENSQESGTDASQSVSNQADQADDTTQHSEGHHGNQTAGQPASDPVMGGSAEFSTVDGMLTLEDAKAKVLGHAGLTTDQVTFVEAMLDYENGHPVYELEFYTSDYREYDYEIDVYSGEIVSFDYDAENYTSSQTSGAAITVDEAKKLALFKVPGAGEGDIREFEVDYDDGRTEYEGKIIYNGTEYEFEIDGSGQILSWEEESVRKQ